MDKIARLRQEIERRITDNTFGAKLELIDILAWLDTLSEEPDKSLEEAAEDIYKIPFGTRAEDFIAGAEWQASQMPMPEDTVLFQKGVAEGRRLEREDMLKDAVAVEVVGEKRDLRLIDSTQRCLFNAKRGDWLRIVVLKEEEE